MENQEVKLPISLIKQIAGIMASKDPLSPNYLKGPQLVELFNDIGFCDSYSYTDGKGIQTPDFGNGLSRLVYTVKRLQQLNDLLQLPKAIDKFAKLVKEPNEAVDQINEILSKNVIPANQKIKKSVSSIANNIADSSLSSMKIEMNVSPRSALEESLFGKIPAGVPVAFISYSWDNEAHMKWVANLAADLTKNRIYVLLDQYIADGLQLPIFMDLGIERADKVIVIGTENYREKFYYPSSGVAFEGSIIRGNIFQNLGTKRFIPCVRQGDFQKSLPLILSGCKGHNFVSDDDYESELETLCREIWGKPLTTRPPLGEVPEYAK